MAIITTSLHGVDLVTQVSDDLVTVMATTVRTRCGGRLARTGLRSRSGSRAGHAEDGREDISVALIGTKAASVTRTVEATGITNLRLGLGQGKAQKVEDDVEES